MPNYWLLKTEPSTYSYDQLEREGKSVWDGVRNNTALMHLRAMKPGDRALIYHSGSGKEIVGWAQIASAPYPDPQRMDLKLTVVDVVPRGRFAHPVPLSAIKADPAFEDFALVRISRLSVMPVTAIQWKRLMAMGEGKAPATSGDR